MVSENQGRYSNDINFKMTYISPLRNDEVLGLGNGQFLLYRELSAAG
jgi:hypothetical protein